nr:ABC transporter C family member 3-like [Tanacetum cinerariifolium]
MEESHKLEKPLIKHNQIVPQRTQGPTLRMIKQMISRVQKHNLFKRKKEKREDNYWMAWASPVSASDPAPVEGSTLIIVYVALAAGSTTDHSAVDMQIPYQVGSFVFAIIQLLGIIEVMSQCAWQVIIVFIPVAGMCIWLQHYQLPSAREMARLGGISRHDLKLNDDFARPKFHAAAAAMEWLGIRLDMLSSFTFVAFLIFLISIPEGTIDPKSNRPDDQWPSQGEVDIRHLQVRYAPHMPLVLRGLTCTFSGGKKTGIVGRTGTIRSNLDPLEEYTDDKIWEALDKCQLGDEVRSKEGKLDTPVTENGENWSVGERQLVCLGRVLLKKSKVLVLDEATASVDTATDGMIQQTLNLHFNDSTVIMIAHRITSVLDSDMALVLEQGLIEEYDSPTKLLEDKLSAFAKLVAEYSMRSSSSFENLAAT